MAQVSEFKSRFRPKFNPSTKVFSVTKILELETGPLAVGDKFVPSDFKIDGRRLRLLYEQRHIEPAFADPALETKFLAEKEIADKKAAEEEAKRKAAEVKS